MELQVIKDAIKHQYNKHKYKSLDDFLKNDCKAGDKAAARYGPLTSEIASKLGIDQNKARYHLNKFCKSGDVFKWPTAGGQSRWSYNGFLDEIRDNAQ